MPGIHRRLQAVGDPPRRSRLTACYWLMSNVESELVRVHTRHIEQPAYFAPHHPGYVIDVSGAAGRDLGRGGPAARAPRAALPVRLCQGFLGQGDLPGSIYVTSLALGHNGNLITPSFETLRHKIGAGHRPRAHGARIQGYGRDLLCEGPRPSPRPGDTICVFPAARTTSSEMQVGRLQVVQQRRLAHAGLAMCTSGTHGPQTAWLADIGRWQLTLSTNSRCRPQRAATPGASREPPVP